MAADDDDIEMARQTFSPEEMRELFDDLYNPDAMRELFGAETHGALVDSLWPGPSKENAETLPFPGGGKQRAKPG